MRRTRPGKGRRPSLTPVHRSSSKLTESDDSAIRVSDQVRRKSEVVTVRAGVDHELRNQVDSAGGASRKPFDGAVGNTDSRQRRLGTPRTIWFYRLGASRQAMLR